MKTIICVFLICVLLLIGCTKPIPQSEENIDKIDYNEKAPVDKQNEKGFVPLNEREIKTLRDGTKYIVHPSQIISGGPPKDGIPSIDNPKFVSMKEADKWIEDNELVMSLIYKGEKRVYPLQIMVWHEIVNDVVAGDPLLITYCPLCGTGIAYSGKINGEAIEFGTSGKLYNSNLVMYDRTTESYWSQIDGISIMGEMTGTKLKAISINTVVWREWKEENEEAKVLSQDTGFVREYGRDPYGSYYEDSFLFFPVENEDTRIHSKTVIAGVNVESMYKAYSMSDIKEFGTIYDELGGRNITLEINLAGELKVTDTDSNEEIVWERHFWFSWYAFHPKTELYNKSEDK